MSKMKEFLLDIDGTEWLIQQLIEKRQQALLEGKTGVGLYLNSELTSARKRLRDLRMEMERT